ncbi:fermitin family homolog 3-like [Corapipo altera]|uniref:fermitin family homolog 3-like n=1 Tax=Corapipo altera TaxID=415028 RepID=UPI000FD6228E|nr:fermitin family homolog 3-like [Corapipo altera]
MLPVLGECPVGLSHIPWRAPLQFPGCPPLLPPPPVLSGSGEPQEEEWELIARLATACSGVLEAIARGGHQLREPLNIGVQQSLSPAVPEDESRSLSEKVAQLEAALKRLQEGLQEGHEVQQRLQAELRGAPSQHPAAAAGPGGRERAAQPAPGGDPRPLRGSLDIPQHPLRPLGETLRHLWDSTGLRDCGSPLAWGHLHMAWSGLKTASGEDIDGSFELQVEVEEGGAMGQGDATGQGDAVGQPSPPAALRILALRVTGDLHIGGLMRLIVETIGEARDWSDHALWWVQQRRWLLPPGPPLDALGVGGGSRLRFAPRHRPLRLRLPGGHVLRLHLDFARTPGRGVARVCSLLGIRNPEELSLLRPEEEGGGEGRGRKGRAPAQVPPDLDLTHLRPRADEAPPPALPPEQLRVLVTPRGGRDPPTFPRTRRGNLLLRRAQLHARWLDASRSLMEQDVVDDEELLLRFKYPCAMGLDPQEGGLRIALLHEQARGALLAEEIDCTEEEMLLFAALQYQIDGAEGGSSRWPFWGSRPARAVLSGSSLSLWSLPRSGGPPQQLNLRGCEVTPDMDLGAQKFYIKLRVPTPEGMSETLLRCRDVAAVAPPRFQRKFKAKQLTPRLLEVLHRVGALTPGQARLRFVEAWRALPEFGLGHFVVRFQGARRDEILAVGPSQLLRIDPGSGTITRSWRHSDLRQWDVNWDSQQVRLWLTGDVTLGLRVLSAAPRVLHQFLGGYLVLGGQRPGQPPDPDVLRRLMEGGDDP